jgi:hypothetical protein
LLRHEIEQRTMFFSLGFKKTTPRFWSSARRRRATGRSWPWPRKRFCTEHLSVRPSPRYYIYLLIMSSKIKCAFLRKDKTGNYSPIVALCSEANVWWKFFIWTLLIMVFYNIIYFKMTSQYYIVFKSVVWKKGDKSFQINAVLGLGVCRIEPRFSPESCVLPCAPLHIHLVH